MKRWPVVGVGLAVVWLFVRGVTLDPAVIAGEFLLGLAVGLPIAFVFRRFYLPEIALGERIRGLPFAVVYLALFLKELATANVDVAYRVLSPSMPIDPDVIELPLRVETDLAIATIANSITLTPGTLTMDYDADRNSLYVHAIDGRDPEAVVEPIRTWEGYALRIFDEDRDPDDPVPDPDAVERSDESADRGDAVVDESGAVEGADDAVVDEGAGAEVADRAKDRDGEAADRPDDAGTGGERDGD